MFDKNKGIDIFEVWKEYENIAMHFNELIIRLRIQALGGIATISALTGFFSMGDTPADFRWSILGGVLFLLCLVWVAIWRLDMSYYDKLLIGSVDAIIEVERLSKKQTTIGELNMSQKIENATCGNSKRSFCNARNGFYLIVLIALLIWKGQSRVGIAKSISTINQPDIRGLVTA